MSGVPWTEAGEDDGLVISVCSKWSRRNLRNQPGNREGRCAECGRMLVVSPQTQALKRRADVRGLFTVCIRCAQANIPGERIKAVPGAVDAFAQAAGISTEAAEAVVRSMGDIPIGEHDADLLDGPEDV